LIDQATIEPADKSASERRGLAAGTCLRQTLRIATSAPHARLHQHPGFAAIQNGTIDRIDYRSLLVRLYGFHVAFEAAADITNERSAWLQEDLATLAVDACALASVPRCSAPMTLDTPARRLGALYVVEGSTLGGQHLARNLDTLLGPTAPAGRSFFLGRGRDTSAAWHGFQERLASLAASTPCAAEEVVAAAVASFGIFEVWMRDWKSETA
jgi:heme oxygenase